LRIAALHALYAADEENLWGGGFYHPPRNDGEGENIDHLAIHMEVEREFAFFVRGPGRTN
jgi:hypothetical protein